MRGIATEFGFYPKRLEVDAGIVTIQTLSSFDEGVDEVRAYSGIDNGWYYPPSHPYGSRLFGLPKTHVFEHKRATSRDHIEFHIWALSFFLGMRLTTTERGFLDATPVETSKLVDFELSNKKSLCQAINLTEKIWTTNLADPRNVIRITAAIHALFLGRYPQALQFERFIYLYAAIDACYRLSRALGYSKKRRESHHYRRIKYMCRDLGVKTPSWAEPSTTKDTVVSVLRNDALHEALFVGQPFGFEVYGKGTGSDITFDMSMLVCRLLVALFGGADRSYIESPVNARLSYLLSLA